MNDRHRNIFEEPRLQPTVVYVPAEAIEAAGLLNMHVKRRPFEVETNYFWSPKSPRTFSIKYVDRIEEDRIDC